MSSDYDEFDFKITESKWARNADNISVQVTSNGWQWVTLEIPRRHATDVAKAILARVSLVHAPSANKE